MNALVPAEPKPKIEIPKELESTICWRKTGIIVICVLSPLCWYGYLRRDESEQFSPLHSKEIGFKCNYLCNGWDGQCYNEPDYYLTAAEMTTLYPNGPPVQQMLQHQQKVLGPNRAVHLNRIAE